MCVNGTVLWWVLHLVTELALISAATGHPLHTVSAVEALERGLTELTFSRSTLEGFSSQLQSREGGVTHEGNRK